MVDFTLDDDASIQYLGESREQLAIVEANLPAIEDDGAGFDDQRVSHVILALQKIKAGSEVRALAKIGALAHQMVKTLALIRSRKTSSTPGLIRTLLRANGRLSDLIESSETSNQADISELTAALGTFADNRKPVLKSSAAGGDKAHRGEGPLRMLLVDDDFSCRLLLQTFLSRYGECHVAVNGIEAVEAFASALEQGRGYNLICMDILMPKMNGREAVVKIRALERDHGILSSNRSKIFMTTIVAEVRQVIQSFQELCDAYLMKPIDLEQLLNQMKLYQLLPYGISLDKSPDFRPSFAKSAND